MSSGCGCKEVYRFTHITYPYSSCIRSFLKQHPYFLFIFKMFFVRRRIRRRKKKNQITIFYFTRCVSKLCYYSDVIHSFDWKSAVEHDGGV